MFVLNAYFCRELKFVAILRSKLEDFYSEIKELTQILLRISEEKIGGWSLWTRANDTLSTDKRAKPTLVFLAAFPNRHGTSERG